MTLYQQILLLNTFFKGKFIIENVIPYYGPLIKSYIEVDRHLFWLNYYVNKENFDIKDFNLLNAFSKNRIKSEIYVNKLQNLHNIDLSNYNISNTKKQLFLRNCVTPEIGLHFLNRALEIQTQSDINEPKLF